MSYKTKNKIKTVECPTYLGSEHICPIMNEVCGYVNNVADCAGYQVYFMPDRERLRMEDRGIEITVEALGLKKINGRK